MPNIESAQSGVERQGAPVIYLVDDDPSFLRALSRRLRGDGYEVEWFGSVEEFLRRHRSDIPGCAVLDLQMPGPGGLELQETLAQADDPLPVVFLTAHGDVPSSVRAMKGGAVDFLRKPVRGDNLLNAIRLALARGALLLALCLQQMRQCSSALKTAAMASRRGGFSRTSLNARASAGTSPTGYARPAEPSVARSGAAPTAFEK